MEHLKFQDLDLSPEICKAVLDMGFEEATPIQSMAISVVKEGRDVIGQSQTGTGKTAAFGIPCLERVNPDDRRLQALILCPTRELAIQVSEEFRKLLKYKENIRVLPIYGGQPIDRQIAALKKGAHVVIGTPGRVMDHMRRRTLKMETVQMMVLDEADEMLDMGFREDIEMILTKIPEDHQTLLFSATLSPEILDITRRFLKDPEFIKVVRKELTVPNIEQAYFDVKEKTKLDALTRIIDVYDPRLAMVFCNTKKRVDDVVELLQGRGYFAEGLHGDLKQPQRDKVMQKFRNGTIEILVATDVAARGIDVDDIDVVFNYDVPQDEEYYVHRIGRTGRAGKSGKAFTFCVGKEIYKLRDIMRYTKTKIAQQKLPTLSDVEEMKTNIFLDKLKDTMNEGHLTKYINLVDRLMQEDFTAIDIAAALLKNHLSNVNVDELDVLDDINLGGTEVYGGDDEKMVRLFINAGKKNKIRTKDIVGAIANETGVPGKVLGAIDLYDDYAFVDIPKEYVKDVLVGMKNAKIKNKRIHMEIAKKDKSKKNN
ncbi:DEAD/DEAH box helicase [Anaerotignum propionicum]|uniref:ATP-dependent RNA helicase CshA n=1 Tax=Anaerotignum propionicum DSM 1682 TaxID=991789 RepID=A0A0X1U6V6_ANAPI|nr:DEAD/DEAH box helicase [Anaerotignum propionicum]AMJ40661.1 DEAD-box ATP-dependent RNA helicase CshA [Anaerotignum propionicum DSM 1682]MEA5058033.1 DEAD/DEAH box helicase [Anaerotignum propionicum]SHE90699.1 ATP-dependent RNA helicase DeaD [[Clostridium] propionicum DSM 1682] [Anaerotignum propionicum DSM 1682]